MTSPPPPASVLRLAPGYPRAPRPGAWRRGDRLRGGRLRGARLRAPLLMLLALAMLWLPGCGGQPRPAGELLGIEDDQHRIANPARIGASATGKGCGVTRQEALTSAQRVAHFNLRSLTGQARYNVRFDLVAETRTTQGVCIEVSALAVAPVPYER